LTLPNRKVYNEITEVVILAQMTERTRQIIHQLASGETQAAVARELNISRQRVNRIIYQEQRRALELAMVEPRRNEHGVTHLRVMRTGRGWSFAQLARLSGLSADWLQKMERGRPTKLRNARRIADVFGFPLGVLFVLEEQPPADPPGA
jgi:transcriptional regulator with XRE-family HTH domain